MDSLMQYQYKYSCYYHNNNQNVENIKNVRDEDLIFCSCDYSQTSDLSSPNEYTLTQKGALSLQSTGNACLNLFFKLTRDSVSNPLFFQWIEDAWSESPLATMRILFHSRDCRGGKGDRAPFLKAMKYIIDKYPTWFYKNIHLVSEYGRYLDLIELMSMLEKNDSGYLSNILIMVEIVIQLQRDYESMNKNGRVSLLAKWIPSEGKHWDKKTGFTTKFCRLFFNVDKPTMKHRMLLRKEYLVPLREYIDVVETKMCAQKWEEIKFSTVPGVAMHRLKDVFRRHVPELFDAWLREVQEGKQKIQAKTVYPHTLVSSIERIFPTGTPEGEVMMQVIEAQWDSLVQEITKSGPLGNSVVVCDVSGSMEGQPLEVAIGLGLLIASVASPPFQNALITFSESPQFYDIPSYATRLRDKVHGIKSMKWGASTNFQKVFDVILYRALENRIAPEFMPTRLYVLSDMQFDIAFNRPSMTSFEAVRKKYSDYGYEMPEIVFWNLRSNDTSDFPVKQDERGVAMVSGFSPSILTYLLQPSDSANTSSLTPMNLMNHIINSNRYKAISSPDF